MPWRTPAKLYHEMLDSGKVKPPLFIAGEENPDTPHRYTDTRNINRLD